MAWSKGHSDKAICLSCNGKVNRKPLDGCKEENHFRYYENKKKTNNEYRRKRRKSDPYYATGFDKESWKKYSREKIRNIRSDVIQKMGGKCIVCGYDDNRALQVDHINGGGGKERKVYGWKYWKFLNKLTDMKEYQLLCSNCHSIKSYYEKYID